VQRFFSLVGPNAFKYKLIKVRFPESSNNPVFKLNLGILCLGHGIILNN